MSNGFAVVDLFAGPGGLAEGFSAVRTPDGARAYRVALSVEMDTAAHSTLLLRTFLRQFDTGPPPQYIRFLNEATEEPDWGKLYPEQWKAAEAEALKLTLGAPDSDAIISDRLAAIRAKHGGNTIVIGGPPCQAYSLVGRARNQGKAGYIAEDDPKHRLYEQYVGILEQLRPAAFVMENVKGMLSSSLDGSRIFERVLDDLRTAGGRDSYTLVALGPKREGGRLAGVSPASSDFVIRAEDFGLPQARHRVIVVGVRRDIHDSLSETARESLFLPMRNQRVRVRDVLDGMPRLRSGLSREADSGKAWAGVLEGATTTLAATRFGTAEPMAERFGARLAECRRHSEGAASTLPRKALKPAGIGEECPADLKNWITSPTITSLANNETRSHMASDLSRYLFAALHGEIMGRSPKASDYPPSLAPDHRNWDSGKFADRFRVQLFDSPSTTVTSHIAKDGHYFIHPDPTQCRSLTVREAARLQTFPDDYYFKGNRTEQFTQVGNAVPPFLAKQIGEVLYSALASTLSLKESVSKRQEDKKQSARWVGRHGGYQSRSAARRHGFRR